MTYIVTNEKRHHMVKYILASLFVAVASFCAPVQMRASAAIEIIDNEPQLGNVSIAVSGGSVRVSGANGQTLYVYNVAGVRIQSVKVDGADRHFDFNLPKGCYILKVGNTVRKISVK